MSKTPRTDDLWRSLDAGLLPLSDPAIVMLEHARELELAHQSAIARAEEAEKDAGRLDFVLERQAFILTTPPREPYGTLYQLEIQDEDENFIAISGEGKFFTTARAAIDAALAALREKEEKRVG